MTTLLDRRHIEPAQAPPETELFCSSIPELPRAWDSTMLGLLKECPRKFKYVIIDGWQSNGFAAHLAFGIAYHKALEQYDKDIAEGFGHDSAVLRAVQFCLSYGTRNDEGKFIPYDSAFTKEPNKTRDTLLRSIVWYLEHFKDDPLETVVLANGKPAVELSFKINLELQSPDGDPFILCGHFDRIVQQGGEFFYLDRKTSKNELNPRYWAQFSPNNQMSLYHSATQLVLSKPARGGIIDAVQIGVTFARFKRHQINRTPGQLQEWLQDTYHWIGMAMQYASQGYWPMNDKSCGNYGGCAFQPICSRDPKVREVFLKNEGYHKRRWNPLESR